MKAAMFIDAKSHADQSKCVSHLADHCIEIKKRLNHHDADARVVAMNNMTAVARSGQMILNLLDSWARGDESIRQFIPQILGLTPVTKESVDLAGKMLSTSSKLSLVLLAQFQVENCLRNVGMALGVTMTGAGFFAVAKPVLAQVGLSHHLDTLNVAALIRNSLHSNGIHHGHRASDTTVDIDGTRYEFLHGKRVQCADWQHIAHALNGSVGILEEIFKAAPVMALTVDIVDHYAWEMATLPGAP